MPEIKVVAMSLSESNIFNRVTLAKANASMYSITGNADSANPWTAMDVDKLAAEDIKKEYRSVVRACRFFYRRDPIASTVINKLVDISMSGLSLKQGLLVDNKFKIFEAVLPKLEAFLEDCTLEYLVTGMVIPEVGFDNLTKKQVSRLGIKGLSTLRLPESYWIRDVETVKIKTSMLGNKPSYFVEITEKMRAFIMSKGVYPDNTEDKELYRQLVKMYPDFIRAINDGDKEVLLENPLVLRRKVLADSPYPLPYLYPAIESFKHKRNLKRMDYSVASRAISAIQLITLGSDEFPLLEGDDYQLDELRDELRWRDSGNRDIERIYQLFGNHTLSVKWVFPPLEVLTHDRKYVEVNMDIFYGLGFPKILMTGETEKSGTSDAEVALLSPVKTMEVLRKKMILIVRDVLFDIAEENRIKTPPEVNFLPMDLTKMSDFLTGLQHLYEGRNISRTTYANKFDIDWSEEVKQIAVEKIIMKDLGVEDFAPMPHSSQPNDPNTPKETNKPKDSSE